MQPLCKTVWIFLKILKIELPFDLAIPFLGIYPEIIIFQKLTCIRMFIAALLTIARTSEQPTRLSTDEWIKTMWHIYMYGDGLVSKSCLTLVTPRTIAYQTLLSWDSPGENTRVGCHFFLQGILLIQGLLHCRQILYWLSYKGSLYIYMYIYTHTHIHIYVCVCACV